MYCFRFKHYYSVNKEGVLETKKQRKFFSIIDGIIGGEGDGPLNPTKKKSGVLIVGEELLLVDLIISGFDLNLNLNYVPSTGY